MGKVKGIKCKVQVVDSIDTPTPKILGGQRSATLNRSAESLDATSKDSDWKENLQGMKEWSVDADGLLIESDEAYDMLEEAFMDDGEVGVIITLPSGKKYSGNAVITDFPLEFPYDDLVTYTVAFTGNGPLEKETGTVQTTQAGTTEARTGE